jgi:hypothetical protein
MVCSRETQNEMRETAVKEMVVSNNDDSNESAGVVHGPHRLLKATRCMGRGLAFSDIHSSPVPYSNSVSAVRIYICGKLCL